MRLRDFPSSIVKFNSYSFDLAQHTRGDGGLSGHYSFGRGGGARWVGGLDVVPKSVTTI